MTRIVLPEGQQVSIEFEGTDGCVTVGFITGDDAEAPGGESLPRGIAVHADLPDALGRRGIVYHAPFSEPDGWEEPLECPPPC